MDVVTPETLKYICIKSLGSDKLREAVESGLAPQELFVEPYKPQEKPHIDDKNSNKVSTGPIYCFAWVLMSKNEDKLTK